MKENYEFRVVEEFASRLFQDSEGKKLGTSIRKIKLAHDDPRFTRVGALQTELGKAFDRSFFHGWSLIFNYTQDELKAAPLLHLKITSCFEPAGEERGTKYDNSTACPHCGSGAKQIGPLFLDARRIPKSKDFSRTIAGEMVVSRRTAELFARHGITGAELLPIRLNSSSSVESKEWFQLTIPNANAEIIAPTRVGIDPFDDDEKGECRCPLGDLAGLNLLSEVSIKSASRGDQDIIATRQFVGTRRGLLRPERIILVSNKVWQLVKSEKLKGIEIDVAHLG